MKNRYLGLFALIIPGLPYFMPNTTAYLISLGLLFLWFFWGVIVFFVFLFKSFFGLFIKEKNANFYSKYFKNSTQILLALVLSFVVYLNFYKVVRYTQIYKLECLFEKKNLYDDEECQLFDKSKSQNTHSNLFLINYSEALPNSTESNSALAKIYYKKDILFENWDCYVYYSKSKPGTQEFPPFKIIKEGKHGYYWYEWCNY